MHKDCTNLGKHFTHILQKAIKSSQVFIVIQALLPIMFGNLIQKGERYGEAGLLFFFFLTSCLEFEQRFRPHTHNGGGIILFRLNLFVTKLLGNEKVWL